MGKIQIIGPQAVNNSAANALFQQSADKLANAFNPLAQAVDRGLKNNEERATGILQQYIMQNDPSSPDFEAGYHNLKQQLGVAVDEQKIAATIDQRQESILRRAGMELENQQKQWELDTNPYRETALGLANKQAEANITGTGLDNSKKENELEVQAEVQAAMPLISQIAEARRSGAITDAQALEQMQAVSAKYPLAAGQLQDVMSASYGQKLQGDNLAITYTRNVADDFPEEETGTSRGRGSSSSGSKEEKRGKGTADEDPIYGVVGAKYSFNGNQPTGTVEVSDAIQKAAEQVQGEYKSVAENASKGLASLQSYIGVGEGTRGKKGYDINNYNTGRKRANGKDLYAINRDYKISQMTLGEVRALQKKGKLNAIGKYQFTGPTLEETAKKMGIDYNTQLTPAVQDQLFVGLLLQGGEFMSFMKTGRGIEDAAAYVARRWASVPKANGLSHYHGDQAGNRAHASLTYSGLIGTLQGMRKVFQEASEKGLGTKDAMLVAAIGGNVTPSDEQIKNSSTFKRAQLWSTVAPRDNVKQATIDLGYAKAKENLIRKNQEEKAKLVASLGLAADGSNPTTGLPINTNFGNTVEEVIKNTGLTPDELMLPADKQQEINQNIGEMKLEQSKKAKEFEASVKSNADWQNIGDNPFKTIENKALEILEKNKDWYFSKEKSDSWFFNDYRDLAKIAATMLTNGRFKDIQDDVIKEDESFLKLRGNLSEEEFTQALKTASQVIASNEKTSDADLSKAVEAGFKRALKLRKNNYDKDQKEVIDKYHAKNRDVAGDAVKATAKELGLGNTPRIAQWNTQPDAAMLEYAANQEEKARYAQERAAEEELKEEAKKAASSRRPATRSEQIEEGITAIEKAMNASNNQEEASKKSSSGSTKKLSDFEDTTKVALLNPKSTDQDKATAWQATVDKAAKEAHPLFKDDIRAFGNKLVLPEIKNRVPVLNSEYAERVIEDVKALSPKDRNRYLNALSEVLAQAISSGNKNFDSNEVSNFIQVVQEELANG